MRLIERKRLRIENDKRQSKAEMSTWSPAGNSDVASEVGVLTLRRPHITPAPGETPGLPPGTRTSHPKLAFLHFAGHTSPHHRARRPVSHRELGRLVRSWRSYAPPVKHHPGIGRDYRAPPDRVGCRGFRPGTLPHHRTCGFPHTAVERSGYTAAARSDGTTKPCRRSRALLSAFWTAPLRAMDHAPAEV